MNFPENLRYTDQHEWIRNEGNLYIVGITDFAQSQLGDIVYIELPKEGKTFKKGEVFGTVEAVKSVSDLYTPVSCEVVEVNSELVKTPELINRDPYNDGWIIKVSIKDPAELDSLLTAEQYRRLIGQ